MGRANANYQLWPYKDKLCVRRWSDAGSEGRVRCWQEVQCQEPKIGQQKVELCYKDNPLCPSRYFIYLCRGRTWSRNPTCCEHCGRILLWPPVCPLLLSPPPPPSSLPTPSLHPLLKCAEVKLGRREDGEMVEGRGWGGGVQLVGSHALM